MFQRIIKTFNNFQAVCDVMPPKVLLKSSTARGNAVSFHFLRIFVRPPSSLTILY